MSAQGVRRERLARRYQHRVLFFARRVARSYKMGSRWDDELVSAGYMGLAKALSNLRPDASEWELSAYVSRRIQGAVIDEARVCLTRDAVHEVVTPLHDGGEWAAGVAPMLETSVAEEDTPEERASLHSLRGRIDRALAVLDANERRQLVAYAEGASIKELAEAEGVPPGTMRRRFRKSLRQVRAHAPDMRRRLLERDSA